MKITIRPPVFFALLLALSGCAAQYTRAEAGVHRTDAYRFSTPIDWSQRSGRPVVWTVDGESLEFLFHFEGIRNGATIFDKMPEDLAQPFSSDMRPSEVIDIFVESFGTATGARAVRMLSLNPSEFGPWRGFSFDFEFESIAGLAMRAVGHGAIIDRRLYLFVYAGARAYYFEKYLPHVEKMIESIAPIG